MKDWQAELLKFSIFIAMVKFLKLASPLLAFGILFAVMFTFSCSSSSEPDDVNSSSSNDGVSSSSGNNGVSSSSGNNGVSSSSSNEIIGSCVTDNVGCVDGVSQSECLSYIYRGTFQEVACSGGNISQYKYCYYVIDGNYKKCGLIGDNKCSFEDEADCIDHGGEVLTVEQCPSGSEIFGCG